MGTASKDPVISTRKTNQEQFAGGVLAVGNHIAQFCENIELISVLGSQKSQECFIKNHLNKNIKPVFFFKKNSETIVKTRFLEEKRLTKIFKIENSDGEIIPTSIENDILRHLKSKIKDYEILVVSDFGHGLLSKNIRKYITKNSNYLALNVQTNSSNFGFNTISKYDKANFISLNNRELQMYFQDNEYHNTDLLKKLIKIKKYNKILLTASNEGVIFFDGNYIKTHKAFTSRPVDTIGAGDAVFSIGSLFSYINQDEYIPQIANIVGAIAVKIIGNKEPVTKSKILDFIDNEKRRNK